MSLLQRARDAAVLAADQARQAAERASDADNRDALRAGVSQAGEQARGAIGLAKRGVKTVIERIDPSTLAEVVIRATALQEAANRALREKASPYRISGISISATVPPGVSFSIGRVEDPDKLTGAERTSTELAAEATSEQILSLDGSQPACAGDEMPAEDGV